MVPLLQVDDLDAAMGMLTPFAGEHLEDRTVLNPFDEGVQAQLLRQLEPAPDQVHFKTSLQHSAIQAFTLGGTLATAASMPSLSLVFQATSCEQGMRAA